MYMIGSIDRQDFEAALVHARTARRDATPVGLAAPFDEFSSRIAEVWDAVEEALRESFQYGADMARDAIERAVTAAGDLLRTAGRRARQVHEELLAYLKVYMTGIFEAGLAQVRQVVTVANQNFALHELEISQKISLTGSLKACITEVAALTGAGEIGVLARYTAGSASSPRD